MYFLSLNTKNGASTLTNRDEEDDSDHPDHQNEVMTTAQKVFKTWKKGNTHLSNSSGNHRGKNFY